ncbi:hypothetical protein JCM10207_000490 [Rhodosporidiobolus poonsookiae]
MSDAPAPTSAPPQPDARLTKRRLVDAMSGLDAAFKEPVRGGQSKKRKTSSGPPPRTSTPALEAILARSSPLPPSTPSTAAPPASYTPTSLPALLDRLSTYRLSSFSPSKPASLSALACALHGWTHTPTTRERVQCVTCARGVVLLPPEGGGGWTSAAGKKLRDEYEKALFSPRADESLHRETCPWRMRPAARGLYRLPGGGLGVQPALGAGGAGGARRRLCDELVSKASEMDRAGLGEMRVELPREAEAIVGEGADGRDRLIRAVAQDVDAASEQPALSATALLLALFGWALPAASAPSPALSRSNSTSSLSSLSSLTSSSSPILTCTYCHRSILTSSYLPTAMSPRPFDLAKQHQPYCPFVASPPLAASPAVPVPVPATATSATALPALKPGWQTRLEAVLRRGGGAGTPAGSRAAGEALDAGAAGGDASASAGLIEPGKTKELLSYIRSLLGPKPKAKLPRAGLPSVASRNGAEGRTA